MDKYHSKGSHKLPTIDLDPELGKLLFEGRCIPEDAEGFFQPVSQWLKEYGQAPQPRTIVNFKLEYFNTSSSKWILQILKTLRGMQQQGLNVEINWHYDDDDLMEYAQHIIELTEISMTLVAY